MPSYDVIIYVKYFIMWHFKSIVDLIYGIINSLNTDEKVSVERGRQWRKCWKSERWEIVTCESH